MKKNLTHILIIIAVAVPFLFSGCILDALNTVTQNIPINKKFYISSSDTSYSKSETIDLSNSTTYQRYEDKIQQISFVQAEFRTVADSVIPSNLSGNVTLTVKDNSGNLLFSYPLGTITPADYESSPFQLSLSSSEIKLINDYLSTLSNKIFVATISITNVSPTPYSLVCAIDIVFQMKAKTS